MKKIIWLFLIMVWLVLLVLAGVFLPRDFRHQEKIIFQIKRGEGSREIAQNLVKEKLIWSSPFFVGYVLISGQQGKLQAGSYFISPAMNIPQMVQKFVAGQVAKAKITIPEGFTSEQIAQKLEKITDVSRPALAANEGYLFPDTYEIAYGRPIEEIIQIMRNNFEQKTAGLALTPEKVIMASLLEKEVKTKQEKELVAGILWKRLKAGIPLQVDAAPETYDHLGLPQSPICNPGLDSLRAAVYPKNSPYWYYLSKPDGETIFQETLEKHNYDKSIHLR